MIACGRLKNLFGRNRRRHDATSVAPNLAAAPSPNAETEVSANSLYVPLDWSKAEIRLLKLHTGAEESDPIECSLVKTSLENRGIPYIALSYVWGDASITETIFVNGRLFSATTNLVAFLRQWRAFEQRERIGPEKFIWIDAICIDQANIPERNSQVLLMGSIYHNASTVVSWLGTESDDSDKAMTMVSALAQEISKLENYRNNTEWLRRYGELLFTAYNTEAKPTGNPWWAAFAKLLHRSYWSRAWILQEVALAKDVYIACGSHLCPLENFFILFDWLHSIEDQNCPSFLNSAFWSFFLSAFRSRAFQGFKRLAWIVRSKRLTEAEEDQKAMNWAVFLRAENLHATDPRDKIYSLLALCNFNIVPDYSKSIKEVYCEFAKSAIEQKRPIILLYSGLGLHQDSERKISNLPSWVPDWNDLTSESESRPYLGSRSDVAGGIIPQDFARLFSVQGDFLLGSGIVCDEVSAAEPEIDVGGIFSFCSRYIATRTSNKYPTGILQLKAIFQFFASEIDESHQPSVRLGLLFLICILKFDNKDNWEESLHNTLPSLGLSSGQDFLRTFYTMFSEQPKFEGDVPHHSAKEVLSQMNSTTDSMFIARLALSIWECILERSLFHTRNGYIGHGNLGTRSGDLVCILFGCDAPLVLRPVDSHYVNIGSCYVLGLMKGEAIQDLSSGTREAQLFEIH